MSLTSRYDAGNRNHTITCTRSECAGRPAHEAGRHLDQRSEFYDGPDIQLAATSMYVRPSARKIIRDAPGLTPEVVDLVTYIGFLEDQATHARVDRDRGIRDAMARSESCEHHGEQIKGLQEQVHAFDTAQRRADAGRLAVLGLLFELDKVTRAYRDGHDIGTMSALIKAMEEASKKTRAAHDRAWKS